MTLWRLGTAALFGAAMLVAAPVAAQDLASSGTGAELRALDKLNADTQDLTLGNGATGQMDRLSVTLRECRYPQGDPLGDAYAYVTVREAGVTDPIFRGWMFASAPALNPLDHARYDVWVLRCTTS